jgi:DNA replication licensing factor MCM3
MSKTLITSEGKEINYLKRFRAFLESENESAGKYRLQIYSLLENPMNSKTRLIMDIGDLRELNNQDVRSLLRTPNVIVPSFEQALKDFARDQMEEITDQEFKNNAKKIIPKLCLGFTGPFGYHCISPRELLAIFLTCMVRINGVVTRTSLITPKLQRSVHYCPETKKHIIRNYDDAESTDNNNTNPTYPTKDESGNILETEYGLCTYVDLQTITIQEAPETAPPGQLPRSVEIVLENDLVDHCKPGDRVSVVGIYCEIPQKIAGFTKGLFKSLLKANFIEVQSGQLITLKSSLNEIQAFRNFVDKITKKDKTTTLIARRNMLELLADSLAPSIYGNRMIKHALVLQLVGGVGKTLDYGTRLRGDINILLVGDPGVAKSQLLRSILSVSPIVISTTGRGSSGVGLTASLTQDRETSERRLEAGAMVLADKGVVLIDEFDKMSDLDRVAIHEVMEQQTVTIAKAGMHTTLNARCAVLAAANPLYGSYDDKITVSRNLNLPDSLLSRFDLLYIMVDNSSDQQDTDIARHVLSMRKLAIPTSSLVKDLGNKLNTSKENENNSKIIDEMDKEKSFFYNKRFFASVENSKKKLRTTFIGKFVSYIRNRPVEPNQITTEAQNRIISFYTNIRSHHFNDSGLPITARTLETLIRLATANAKLCLDNFKITEEDVIIAEVVLRGSLLGEYCDPLIESTNWESKDFKDSVQIKSEKMKIKSVKQGKNKALDDISDMLKSKISQRIQDLSDKSLGIINFNELRKTILQSKLHVTDAQLMTFLLLQTEKGKLIQGDIETFFVIN